MTYDAAKSDIPFAEDLNKIINSMISIETALGVDFLNIWPIGSVYYNADDNRNPHDIMGFGTWVVHAEGRHIVGKASSGTFDTLGATGGVEKVTLTAAQSGMIAHSHSFPSGNKSLGWAAPNYTNSYQYQAEAITVTTTTSTAGPADATQSHTNLAPYVVDCSWRRTA